MTDQPNPSTQPTGRPATVEDYAYLYQNGYQKDGLKCAREGLPWIISKMPGTVLDYGGGRGHLASYLMAHTRCTGAATYDPAFGPEITWANGSNVSAKPTFDLVCAFDVAEHIPALCAPDFLRSITSYGNRYACFTICTDRDFRRDAMGQVIELHINRNEPGWWEGLLSTPGSPWRWERLPCWESSRHLFVLERV